MEVTFGPRSLPHAGDGDWRAVSAAVNANVYVMDGSRAKSDHVRRELAMLSQLGREIVVLTDPDQFGRELRLLVDDLVGASTMRRSVQLSPQLCCVMCKDGDQTKGLVGASTMRRSMQLPTKFFVVLCMCLGPRL